MARLNLVLLAVLTVCALGLVSSQHQARKLFAELEREQARAQQLEVEFGQLQLEASTWATPSRVEQVARERLRMHPPGLKRLQVTDSREGAK
jgi:cell division protein FtsL